MHLLLLDLCNEIMQCCLNTYNELMQNVLHFHIFLCVLLLTFQIFIEDFPILTPFSLFHYEVNGLFQNKTSFSQSGQHYFLFFSPSSKHFFLYKNLYSMAVAPLFKSFSPFFESFPIFRVHDASSLRTLTPFVF